MKYSFPKLIETLAAGKGLVLATIVDTEGSTPQVRGASAIFSAAGLETGAGGGGFLEARGGGGGPEERLRYGLAAQRVFRFS